MNRAILLALAVGLVTPLAAFADPDVLGTPDSTCQTPDEWRIHDYGAPANGHVITGLMDGNLDGCGNTYGMFFLTHDDCEAIWRLGSTVYNLLCATDRFADFDGDREFAIGGAILVSATGDGSTRRGLACYDTLGHHPSGGTVYANDLWLFSPHTCGPDIVKACLDRCAANFQPGADGAYIVFVGPTLAGNNGEPTGASQGHVSL